MTGQRPPLQDCIDGCGRKVASWAPHVRCLLCTQRAIATVDQERQARRQETLDALEPTPPPRYSPADAEIPF